jgi:hypothetical protein
MFKRFFSKLFPKPLVKTVPPPRQPLPDDLDPALGVLGQQFRLKWAGATSIPNQNKK